MENFSSDLTNTKKTVLVTDTANLVSAIKEFAATKVSFDGYVIDGDSIESPRDLVSAYTRSLIEGGISISSTTALISAGTALSRFPGATVVFRLSAETMQELLSTDNGGPCMDERGVLTLL